MCCLLSRGLCGVKLHTCPSLWGISKHALGHTAEPPLLPVYQDTVKDHNLLMVEVSSHLENCTRPDTETLLHSGALPVCHHTDEAIGGPGNGAELLAAEVCLAFREPLRAQDAGRPSIQWSLPDQQRNPQGSPYIQGNCRLWVPRPMLDQ